MADKFSQHKQRGNELYKDGKYHDAIRQYTKCTDINNCNYLPYANRAMCYLKIGKYEQAETDCTKCLQLAPKYVKGYLRRGAARRALAKFDLALRDYQQVLKLQPKNTQAKEEVCGLSQILQLKKSIISANQTENKSKRQTKIRKLHQNVEYEAFKQMFESSNDSNQAVTKTSNENKIFYGQLIVGPPGSGKTTYCHVISQYMTNVLHRNVAIINLDPNNENMEYHPLINICELISSDDVAEHLHLGPNGSLIYCLEYLSANMHWLRNRLNAINHSDTYLLFDCPGQIELYIHHKFMRDITSTIVNDWHYRLSCVNLVDCYHCCTDLRTNDSSNFISVALMTTSMMLHLELPHINVLSKCDLLPHYDKSMIMPMEFYTDGQDLEKLSNSMYSNKTDEDLLDIEKKFKYLNQELAQCINDYGLVSFVKFAINDLDSMKNVCRLVDKSNGYDLMGEYYQQMELEDKILLQRINEQTVPSQPERSNDNNNRNDDDPELECKDNSEMNSVFGLNNPLLQNTPFSS